jgi:hypothetical protein
MREKSERKRYWTTYEKRVRRRDTGQHTRKELEEGILNNIRKLRAKKRG